MKKISSLLVITLLVLSMIFVAPLAHATGAIIWTDKGDYGTYETVIIFGSGFETLASVTVTIVRPDGTSDTVYAVADNVGNFTCTYQLNGIEGTYTVTATDGTNTASTTFTEAKPVFTITIDTVNGYSPPFPTLTNPIHLAGSASVGPNFPGQLSAYQVQVDWGDTTVDPDSTVNFVQSGTSFSGTWSSNPDHNYATSGTYTITAKLYHQQPPGAESGDAQAQVNVSIVVQANIIVTTSPSGLSIVVDSVTYTAPRTFSWVASSTHSIGTTSPQAGLSGTQYVWTSWSDGGAITHNIVVPGTTTTYTAYFKTQHQVTVTASPAGAVGGTFYVTYTQCGTTYTNVMETTAWTEWVDACTTVTVSSPEDPIYDGPGTRYTFDHYDPSASVHMNGPTTITLFYTTQYYLTVVSPYDTPHGEGWYDECTYAYAWLDYGIEDITANVRAVFKGWIGDASGTGLTSDPIHMNCPKTAVANWTIQYYLDVVTDPAQLPPIPGADWYDNCTWVRLTAPIYLPDEAGVGGVRYKFSYWDVDGTSQGIGVNPIDIHMDEPHVATAHYTAQYYLTVKTDPLGLVVIPGEGWYDECNTVTLTAPSLVPVSSGIRYRFDYWDVDSATVLGNPIDVHMDAPHTATAHYVKQYYLSVKTDPLGLVVIPGEGWYDECNTVTLTAPSLVPVSSGIRYRFDHWDVDTIIVPSNPINVHMDMPHTATAHYIKQYYLTVKTDPFGLVVIPGEGWYDECNTISLTAPLQVQISPNVIYIFDHWDVDTTSKGVGVNTITVHMDAPHTATAHYWLAIPKHLDAEPPRLIDLTKPVCTQWQELYPDYSRHYHLDSWHDTNYNGKLDPSDFIDLWDEDLQEKAYPYWWHVDNITVTLALTNSSGGKVFVEFEGSYDDFLILHTICKNYVGTQWHEVYPTYSNQYRLEKWIDNCDNILSACDQIILRNKVTGEQNEYHVDGVKTDLIVSPRVTLFTLGKTKDFLGQGYPQIIPKNIENYYANTTTFTVSAYYDGLQPLGNQTITLNPLESGDAIIWWIETATWPKGTYTFTITIKIYANNTLVDIEVFPITFKITIEGDIDGDGKADMVDIWLVAQAFGTYLWYPRWNPDADINGDNLVDMVDMWIVSRNFGKIDP